MNLGRTRGRGRGVQNPEKIAGVIYGLPLRGRRETEVQGGPSGRGKPPVDLVLALLAAGGPLL